MTVGISRALRVKAVNLLWIVGSGTLVATSAIVGCTSDVDSPEDDSGYSLGEGGQGGDIAMGCPANQSSCDGSCINLASDASNCGACGNECADGFRCETGICTLSCQQGLAECNDICTDTDSDSNNCGACNAPCAADEVCTGGTCNTAIYESCLDVLSIHPDAPDGIYWIDPSGGYPFPIYCDQTTDGGGWAIVWKNHGGANGGESSNQQLFGSTGADMVLPYKTQLVSQKHERAWQYYWDSPNREWIKITSLWNANDNIEHEETIRVVMGSVTMQDIFSVPEGPCIEMPNALQVYVDGDNFIGETNLVNHSHATTYGLANNGHASQDDCGQPSTNLINDGTLLYRVDGGTGLNAIRHLFSYVHDSAGQNASRCLYACWNGDSYGGYYDAFMWAVR